MVVSVFLKNLLNIFTYVSVCQCVCTCVYGYTRRPEEDTRFSGLRATGAYQLPSEGLGTKLLSSERAASAFNC